MTFSIRHRILMPYLFITAFMTFSGIFFAVSFVQNYFNQQLFNQASSHHLQFEHHLNRILSFQLNQINSLAIDPTSPITFSDYLLDSNKKQQLKFRYLSNDTPVQIIVESQNNSLAVPLATQLLTGLNTTAGIALYIRSNDRYYKLSDNINYSSNNIGQPIFSNEILETHLSLNDHFFIDQIELNDSDYAQYFIPHSQFNQLYIGIITPSTAINQLKQNALIAVIVSFLFINLLISYIFLLILKRITGSLTQITQSAQQMAKGMSVQPVSIQSNDEIGLLSQSFNDMLSNVQSKTSELILERNRSKMILAQLPDGIIVTDTDNRLISANRVAETMLGFSTDRAKGQELIQYIKNENASLIFKNHIEDHKSNTVIRELNIASENGENENYQITMAPLLDTTYQQTGIITMIRNITDETKVRSSRDHFIQTVTHELRTPLTSIIGFLDIILKENFGPLNEKQHEFIAITHHNANYLKKLLSDLLELSRIHSGQIELNQSFFSINSLIDHVMNYQRSSIQRRNNQISIQLPDGNIKFYGDFNKLMHVVTNLIINANKHTTNGTIELCVNQTSTFTSIIVKDSGSGLTRRQKQQLTYALELQSNYNYFSYDGLGLELAIVKELIHIHNGQVLVESEEEKGSIFTIMLPHTTNHDPAIDDEFDTATLNTQSTT